MFRNLSAFLLLSSAVIVASDSVPCPFADNYVYTIPGTNAQYRIECSKDRFITTNLAQYDFPDLQSCIAKCQENSACVAVSYRGSGCYLKADPAPGTSIDNGVVSAIRIVSTTCPYADQSVYSAPGAQFKIECRTDHFITTNLAFKDTSTFGECINYCASFPGCKAVSYRGSGCYLKSDPVPAASYDAGVSSAVRIAATPAPTIAPTIAPTVAPTIAPTIAPTVAPTQAPTPRPCPYSDGSVYTIPGTNARYIVECQKDHFTTTNLAQVDTPTFEACISACQASSSCAAISYRGSGCYLKSNPVPAVTPDPFVTSAVRVVAATCPYADQSVVTVGGKRYRIECNTDRFTISNLAQSDTATFEQCIAVCNGNSGCAAVSYYGSGCYLKSNPVPGASSKSGVSSAVLLP